MSLATTIVMLICGWLAVAGAMLWGGVAHYPSASSPPRKTCQAPKGSGTPRLARHAIEVPRRRNFLAVAIL